MHDSHAHNFLNGIIGISGSLFAVLTTFQEQLEFWVRITGGLLGILIALITLLNFICKWVRKSPSQNE
jgi:sorbitol-specific phosphotransferase system component IIC